MKKYFSGFTGGKFLKQKQKRETDPQELSQHEHSA